MILCLINVKRYNNDVDKKSSTKQHHLMDVLRRINSVFPSTLRPDVGGKSFDRARYSDVQEVREQVWLRDRKLRGAARQFQRFTNNNTILTHEHTRALRQPGDWCALVDKTFAKI